MRWRYAKSREYASGIKADN
jgi:replication factor C subunit 3/5